MIIHNKHNFEWYLFGYKLTESCYSHEFSHLIGLVWNSWWTRNFTEIFLHLLMYLNNESIACQVDESTSNNHVRIFEYACKACFLAWPIMNLGATIHQKLHHKMVIQTNTKDPQYRQSCSTTVAKNPCFQDH